MRPMAQEAVSSAVSVLVVLPVGEDIVTVSDAVRETVNEAAQEEALGACAPTCTFAIACYLPESAEQGRFNDAIVCLLSAAILVMLSVAGALFYWLTLEFVSPTQ